MISIITFITPCLLIFNFLFFRPNTTKANLGVRDVEDEMLDLSAPKKSRKNYGVNPDKFKLASKITKQEYQASEDEFKKMKEDDKLDVKLEVCSKSREFIQAKFRTCEPRIHVKSLKPSGPILMESSSSRHGTSGSRIQRLIWLKLF